MGATNTTLWAFEVFDGDGLKGKMQKPQIA
jgi:hypothetical protein